MGVCSGSPRSPNRFSELLGRLHLKDDSEEQTLAKFAFALSIYALVASNEIPDPARSRSEA